MPSRLNNMDKNAVQQNNKKIKRAILVSQMEDHKGFEVFEEDLAGLIKDARFQDISGLKSMEQLYEAKGFARALEEVKYYFYTQKQWAMKPLINEDTGEEEILNNKNK